jgi:hypothetical protein
MWIKINLFKKVNELAYYLDKINQIKFNKNNNLFKFFLKLFFICNK